MTVITSQILDISSSSTVNFVQWANNTNKIVTDVTNVNNVLTPVAANVTTLKASVTSLNANVSTLKTSVTSLNANVTSIKISISSPNFAAISGLSANGIIVKTSANTATSRTIIAPAAGISITNGNGVSGNPTFSLVNDLSALEGLTSTGIAVRTATDTWAQRSMVAPAAGLTITNVDGVAGNPTFAFANDLSALEALASTGIAVRTATDTWAQRTITGSGAITITNGSGAAGNPTIAVTSANTTVVGVIQLATNAETTTGSSIVKVLTPSNLTGAIGVTVQGFDTNTLKSNASKTLTAGYFTTSVSDGTFTTGTYTPDPTTGAFRDVTNNGAHTFAPPTNTGSFTMVVGYTNGASAGAITTSGWTKVTGDTFTTTNTNKFKCYISKGVTGTHLHVQAMQ